MKVAPSAAHRFKSNAGWNLALENAAPVGELPARDLLEAVARASKEGREVQDDCRTAELQSSQADWYLRVAKIYKRLGDRPWESMPPLPAFPGETIPVAR